MTKSGRPEAGEFAAYAAGDIGLVAGDDAVAALRSQQREILALIASVDDRSIANRTYAPGKWTFKQVIGHLIDDERIFAYRALCVARREPRALPGFDEKEYMNATDFEDRPLAGLAAEYRAVRESSIAFFESLKPEEWVRKGTVNEYGASVRGLAFHICGHELHHLRIIREKYLP
jgi:DinB family protein